MAIFRQFDEPKQTVVLTYRNEPITPVMAINDPVQLLDGLSNALELAYQKLRDAGLV